MELLCSQTWLRLAALAQAGLAAPLRRSSPSPSHTCPCRATNTWQQEECANQQGSAVPSSAWSRSLRMETGWHGRHAERVLPSALSFHSSSRGVLQRATTCDGRCNSSRHTVVHTDAWAERDLGLWQAGRQRHPRTRLAQLTSTQSARAATVCYLCRHRSLFGRGF
jgi:hypothetical protein